MEYIELELTEETTENAQTVSLLDQLNNNKTKPMQDVDITLYVKIPDDDDNDDDDAISARLQISLMLCVMLTAIVANSLMCYAIRKTPNQRIITNILTMNLGVADLGVAVFAMPLMIGIISHGAAISSALCHFTMFITVALLLVQAATLATISLDRYFSICHPLRYPMEMTGRRGYIVLITIWTESILVASTPLFGWGRYASQPQSLPMCLPQWTDSTSHALFVLILGLGVPFACMIVSYTFIIQEARKQSKRIEKLHLTPSADTLCISSDDKTHLVPHGRRLSVLASKWRRPSATSNTIHYSASSRNIKTLKTVFIIVGAFVICWFPYVVGSVWGSVAYPSHKIPASFELSIVLLVYSNCAISPFVFTLLTRDIRHTVYHVLLKMVCLNHSSGGLCGPYCERRGSGVETIRLHSRESRGSMDSGVDVETGFPHTPQLRLHHCFHDNDAYEKSSCSDNENNLLAPPIMTMGPGQMPRLHRSQDDDDDERDEKSKKSSNDCMRDDADSYAIKPKVKPAFHNIPTIVVLGQTE